MSEDDRSMLDSMGGETHPSVTIQTEPSPVPAVPPWFGEGTMIAHCLRHLGVLAEIAKRVRFARRRFGHYDLIDFVVVLLSYAMGMGPSLRIWPDSPTSCEARIMISSIFLMCKPAWLSHQISRLPIPKREPVGRSLTFLISRFRQQDHTRVIVAARAATDSPVRVGTTRGESVYELFYTTLPPGAFTPADVVALYLHRGAFETVLSDEDKEQEPDRWCSHTAWGQEFWLILAQWTWNLRLQLGHALHPTPTRTTEFAAAQNEPGAKPDGTAQPDVSYKPPV